MRLVKQSVATFSCILLAAHAYASAWLQEQGSGQIILNHWYYSTDNLFNNSGKSTDQSTYNKYELNPYLEYGLTDQFTVGANLSLQYALQRSGATTQEQSNIGLGDSEIFARTPLWKTTNLIVSIEPLLKLPSPESSDELPMLGGRHADIGLGLSGGYSFFAYGLYHFTNIDAGYRHRFGEPKDQIKLAATLGVRLSPNWMIMPQVYLTQRATSPETVTFTQSSGDDYNLTKLQLSAVYKWSDTLSLQAGGFSHVSGKNVGGGDGVLFSIWKTF